MISVDDLDLLFLPMGETAFAENPFPYFAAAREKHPWLAKCAFGYVVHDYAAIRDLLLMDGPLGPNFRSKVDLLGATGTPWGRFQTSMMVATSGPVHKRLRNLLAAKFTPRLANQHRPLMREVILKLLDEWAPKGSFDFEEFASNFPITVMCRMIGASPAALPSIRGSLETLGLSSSLDSKLLPALQEAIVVLDQFVQRLVAERCAGHRLSPEHDLLDSLMEADSGLEDRELYDLLILLFVAGYDTSKNTLTLTMSHLIDRPEIYVRCAQDLRYCSKVVEESFRFKSTATIPRVATEEVDYRGVRFPPGTMLFMPVSVSGRDSTAFEDPERFDPEREREHRHIAFGGGTHMCLGQHIARAQITEGLHLIAQRISNPRRTGPSFPRPFFGTWGIRGLPIKFDAEAPAGSV